MNLKMTILGLVISLFVYWIILRLIAEHCTDRELNEVFERKNTKDSE